MKKIMDNCLNMKIIPWKVNNIDSSNEFHGGESESRNEVLYLQKKFQFRTNTASQNVVIYLLFCSLSSNQTRNNSFSYQFLLIKIQQAVAPWFVSLPISLEDEVGIYDCSALYCWSEVTGGQWSQQHHGCSVPSLGKFKMAVTNNHPT